MMRKQKAGSAAWGGAPAGVSVKPSRKNGSAQRPEDVIALDDQQFGKF